jgi:hypothetical protein
LRFSFNDIYRRHLSPSLTQCTTTPQTLTMKELIYFQHQIEQGSNFPSIKGWQLST